ncbi:MAG: hypothetical protein ACOVNQ_14635, partial [Pirellula sp.]
VWALVVLWLDMTFFVMPIAWTANVVALFGHLLGGVGMFAILMAFFLVRAKSAPLVPMKDPRLPEALTYANPIL